MNTNKWHWVPVTSIRVWEGQNASWIRYEVGDNQYNIIKIVRGGHWTSCYHPIEVAR